MNNEELIQKMKEDMKLRGFSKYSYSNYLNKAKHIIEYFKKPIQEVTTKELREYLMIYLREKKKISERSVNYYNSVIRFIYDVTLDIPINKKQIPMYRKKRRLPKILREEELSIFFNACDNYMYKTIFMLIYGTGLRISEAATLKVGDIDSMNMRVFVRNGKGEKERYTVLPKASLEMLRKYYKTYRPNHPEGYLFLNGDGDPMKPERLRVHFRRYRKKAKIDEKFIVHSLRHSFATKLVEEGVPLVQVKELLGHSCIRSTMTYVHIANNMQKVNSPLDIFLEKGEEK
jgi:site-specific recombinase XerD